MNTGEFKNELIIILKKCFPETTSKIIEKRGIILEARVDFSEYVFLEIYYNSLTNKKSFAIIENGERIFGYDNYKFWHVHPEENPSNHIPCNEPTIEEVFSMIKKITLRK